MSAYKFDINWACLLSDQGMTDSFHNYVYGNGRLNMFAEKVFIFNGKSRYYAKYTSIVFIIQYRFVIFLHNSLAKSLKLRLFKMINTLIIPTHMFNQFFWEYWKKMLMIWNWKLCFEGVETDEFTEENIPLIDLPTGI